jgi:Glycosyltransferase family 87
LITTSNAAMTPALPRSRLRLDFGFLHDPRRLLAILIIALSGAAVLVFLAARGELAGSDARAYWAGVRLWVGGGDPLHPTGPFLPYVYAPWTLPLFLPWAALPWSVAWFLWRGVNLLLLLWTAGWAYSRHPLATALVLAILAAPIAATLDTGNITLLLAFAVWAAQFVGPRLGGALWAFAATLKWFPVLLLYFLPPRARLWGVGGLGVALLLALATWPQTLTQLDLAINFPRPLRLDYILLGWAAVPWLWQHPHPLWWLNRDDVPRLARQWLIIISQQLRELRHADQPAEIARQSIGRRVRAFFGVS